VLAALLKNVHLMERLSEIPQTDLEAFQLAAAAEMVLQQTREAAEMQRKGLLVLDTLPDQLSANLVSRYLDVKARHLL
jgi:hypothetical protein